MAIAVTVRGLVKRFGEATAVAGIDLDIKPGQFFTLLGPSGCGKTTTLRMIAGLERPDAGEIQVGDRVVSAIERGVFVQPEKRQMGMVFQSYAVWPHMTVFQNVAFPLREQRVRRQEIKERVMDTLELVDLADFAQRPAPKLSGGQQQRVALARALVGNPQVLLLDEPLSNLDAKLREQMRYEIRTMQQRLGITTIFVTHDQDEAMTLSDEIAVMHNGTVAQIGGPREVYDRPQTRYVMDFLGRVNHLPAIVSVSDGQATALIAGQELPIADTNGLVDGDEAVVAFRSESIELVPDGGDLTATVTAAVYIAGSMTYTVQIGEVLLHVRAPLEIEMDEDSSVGLRISPAVVRLWPRTEYVEDTEDVEGA